MLKWLSNFMRQRRARREELSPDDRAIIEEFLRSHHKTADDYRERFRAAPLGRWSQCVGTFGAVMDEAWEFRADGTGRILETGPFGGERGETRFEWKPVEDFCIACRVTQWPHLDDEEEAEPDEDEDEEDVWSTVRYDFKLVPTDAGDIIAMFQDYGPDANLSGFWRSSEPLSHSDLW